MTGMGRRCSFVSCRMLKCNGEVKAAFLAVNSPESPGANGLLEAVVCPKKKLVGITTDGESANTGQGGGLWKLLQDHLDRKIFTMWCVGHRSDLAIEQIITIVPELKMWKENLTGLSANFRCSKNKT